MKINAYIDKGVLSQMALQLNSSTTLQEKIDSVKIIDIANFITNCNEWYCDGISELDSTNPANEDLLTLLGKYGGFPAPIPNSTSFSDLVKNATPFGMHILNSDSTIESSSLPSYSLNELIKVVKEKNHTYLPITSYNNAFKAFRTYSFPHKINSVIINDRYFFDSSSQISVVSKLLRNYLDKTKKCNVVITIFYTQHIDYQYDDLPRKIKEDLIYEFPNSFFTVEVVPIKHIDENHDRFLFTDFLCCHVGHSFTFLNSSHKVTTSLQRYMMIDTNNFRGNLKYLHEFLTGIIASNPDFTSKNKIINAFTKP